MRTLVWSLIAALLLATPSALAQAPLPAAPAPPRHSYKWTDASLWSVHLVLKLGPGWGVCARYGVDAKRRLRDEVAAHLGYDPFIPFETFTHLDPNPQIGTDAARAKALLDDNDGQPPQQHGEITVKLSGTGRSMTGIATWVGVDEEGRPFLPYTRTIAGTDRYACTELLSNIAVWIHVQFPYPDFAPLPVCAAPTATGTPLPPASAPRPPLPACPESPYSVWPTEWPMPPLPKPVPDPPKPLEAWPIAVRLGVAVWPELVAAGWGSFGFSAEAGARYRAVSLSVEAHGDPSLGSVPFPSVGAVSFARVSGALLLCAHYGWFAGCGVGDVGRFIFPNHALALPASTLYGAVGARAKLEFPVASPWLFLSTALDVRAPVEPAHYTFMGNSVFASAGPGLGLGIGLVMELPL
jgi:hypothetical protein